MNRICEAFPKGIEILEHYGDYFRFRLEREEGLSIGKLFGLVEECKEKLQIINEYSVS